MSGLDIKPLFNMVIIKPKTAATKTETGIILPDNIKEKSQEGFVVAVGCGTKDEPMILKNGDYVLYGAHSGTEFQYNKETYLVMRQSDIYVVVN